MSIFKDETKSIPKDKDGDGTIVRVPLDFEAIGARKSQLARASHGKNSNTISHIKGK